MNTFLIILYAVLILIWGIKAGLDIASDKSPGLVILDIVCAVLWGVCLLLRVIG